MTTGGSRPTAAQPSQIPAVRPPAANQAFCRSLAGKRLLLSHLACWRTDAGRSEVRGGVPSRLAGDPCPDQTRASLKPTPRLRASANSLVCVSVAMVSNSSNGVGEQMLPAALNWARRMIAETRAARGKDACARRIMGTDGEAALHPRPAPSGRDVQPRPLGSAAPGQIHLCGPAALIPRERSHMEISELQRGSRFDWERVPAMLSQPASLLTYLF